jgi:hypothetical protein
MNISGIGVQQITPQTGTGWQGPNPTRDQNNDSDVDGSKTKPSQAPPSPGSGRIVDKIA